MEKSVKTTIEELAKNNWRFGMYDIIFDRENNVCLNGLWSCENDITMNEIARKRDGKKDIEGNYKVTWIQPDNKDKDDVCIIGELVIKNMKFYYSFEWKENGVSTYFGIGIKMNNQLIVFYLQQS